MRMPAAGAAHALRRRVLVRARPNRCKLLRLPVAAVGMGEQDLPASDNSPQLGSRAVVAWPLPPEAVLWVAHLATPLHARHAWRLLPLLRGLLFATGRRTVAAWLRAAGLGPDYKRYYYFLGALGHKTRIVASLLLRRVADVIAPGERIL